MLATAEDMRLCALPFLGLALLLWLLSWLLLRKARRGPLDAAYRARLQEVLEGPPPPSHGNWRTAVAYILCVLLALVAFGVTVCSGLVLVNG